MPAPRYYSTKDVQTILNCSRSYALQVMHMFEQRGKLFRKGRLMRVKIKDFDAWLEQSDQATKA